MSADKIEMIIECQLDKKGVLKVEYDISTLNMALYSGPLTKITLRQPLMPDAVLMIPSEPDFKQILLKLMEHCFAVQKIGG